MDITYQKLPPHSIESEQSILSTAMLGGAIDVTELLTTDDFYRSAHRKIFETVSELVKTGTEVDMLTVSTKLREQDDLESAGGVSYISSLVDIVPASSSIAHHAKIIKTTANKRRMIEACSKTIQSCYEGGDLDELMARHDLQLNNITLHGGSFVKLGDILPGVIAEIEHRQKNPGPPGIPSGLVDVDRKLGGFQGSHLYIIAGRPGMGKTAFGMRVSRGAARNGFPCAWLSFEMSRGQLLAREISCQAGVDGERITNGEITRENWRAIVESGEKIDNLPIWVDDSPTATIKECQSKIRQFCKRHGRSMILIDYLDYIKGEKSDRKDIEIGTITKGLKASAKEHNIPVVLFVQLNRECENRTDKRPMIRDLRNSGEIEQDADVIAFLYRDVVYNATTKDPSLAEFIVRKFRNGKTGTVPLRWIDFRTTFENCDFSKRNG